MFLLNADKLQELTAYLQQQGWISAAETIVAAGKAGQGNMNCVLRADTGARTLILKQSRGYVEKFPHIPAPVNRIVIESLFYKKIIGQTNIKQMMPGLFGVDEENTIMALEDVGNSGDYTFLYDLKEQLLNEEIVTLVSWLYELHMQVKKTTDDTALANKEMRLLNHEHIFNYPFQKNNGFNLDAIEAGLQAIAMPYKNDTHLKKKIEKLGNLYLSEGEYLVHGDFYPGSWLKTANGIKIIDAEFCFYGLREFDLGVMTAHLYLTKHDEAAMDVIKNSYPAYNELNIDILYGFAGTEIMRRLLGLAQLPVKLNLFEKKYLLKKAYQLIMK
jgi:5-methylthioribose kinase